jgi:nucleoid-associated protein EbfC
MFDMLGMMGKVKDMQARIQEVQNILASSTLHAIHPEEDIKVTVNGKKEIIKTEVNPALWTRYNPEQILLFIDQTANMALREADVLAKNLMAEKTEGILPKIPGFDLASLFGR